MLELADQRLTPTSVEGQVFSVPLAAIEQVTFPWYYFGGGTKFRISGHQYRVSFVRPNGAEDIPARLLETMGVRFGAGLQTVVGKVLDIRDGRRVGKGWRAALVELLGC